jgi:CHAT domain
MPTWLTIAAVVVGVGVLAVALRSIVWRFRVRRRYRGSDEPDAAFDDYVREVGPPASAEASSPSRRDPDIDHGDLFHAPPRAEPPPEFDDDEIFEAPGSAEPSPEFDEDEILDAPASAEPPREAMPDFDDDSAEEALPAEDVDKDEVFGSPSAEPPAEAGEVVGADFRLEDVDEDAALGHFGAPSRADAAPELPSESPPRRYANVKIRDAEDRRPSVARLGSIVTVEVAIGALRPDSDVKHPVPVPEHLLPREDLWLDVLFSSPDLRLGRTEKELGKSTAVEGRLLLPSDGSSARTDDGVYVLRFYLALPTRGGRARARLTYLYRNVAIQSQRIDVTAVEGTNNWASIGVEVTTDFTLSESLGHDVASLESRDRVTVVMNDSGSDQHHFTVRAASGSGTVLAPPAAMAVRGSALGDRVGSLREAMSDAAPDKRQRRTAQTVSDLRTLAPLGWELYASLPRAVQDAMRAARAHGGHSVVEVVLPEGVSFTVPWNLVYDIYLDSGTPAQQIPVCPLVEQWDGSRPLIDSEPRECPRLDDIPHTENLLCPFGFWGFRHSFEVLTSTDRPKQTVAMRDPCRIVVAQTQHNIDAKQVAKHVERLRAIFGRLLPGTQLIEARTKAEIRREIEPDLPFLYFICHGEREDDKSATMLGVGKGERISPADINGWIDVALTRDRRIWDDPQPLVFINACESLAITPDDIVDYLDAFVGKGHAAGVIGTEVRVDQRLAMEMAETFFRQFLSRNTTLDAALHRTKVDFLASGNLIGLNYTPYALADLRVMVAA